MNYLFCQLALFLWIPVVVAFFAFLPPRKAVIVSFLIGWLALPNIGFNLPGMPDYSKMTATSTVVLPCMFIFDQGRLFSLRFRRYDLPMIVWCLCPFLTAVLNGLGGYEGLAAMLDQMMIWGFPYLIGRAYFTDLDGLRDLALGIAISGLVYVPPCLFEIRFSPVLETWVYGITHWESMRYGGYRPKVFMTSGLQLGMWMTNASLICHQLWSCGAVKMIWGIGLVNLFLVLLVTTVLCKSSGAVAVLMLGMATLWVTRWTKRSWAIWLLLAIPPSYTILRTFNIWSGQEVVQISQALAGADRAQSIEYRLNMENLLTARAMEQPLFGWGRFNRMQVVNERGQVLTVPDSYWIIALGSSGIVGLASLIAMMLLPLFFMVRRFPVATWSDPRVGPAVSLAMILAMTMVDYLSNAMPNPLYAAGDRRGGRPVGGRPTGWPPRGSGSQPRRRVRPDGRGSGGPG